MVWSRSELQEFYCEPRGASSKLRAFSHSPMGNQKQRDISKIIDFFAINYDTKVFLFDRLNYSHDEPVQPRPTRPGYFSLNTKDERLRLVLNLWCNFLN